jgi:hypothetical protein
MYWWYVGRKTNDLEIKWAQKFEKEVPDWRKTVDRSFETHRFEISAHKFLIFIFSNVKFSFLYVQTQLWQSDLSSIPGQDLFTSEQKLDSLIFILVYKEQDT